MGDEQKNAHQEEKEKEANFANVSPSSDKNTSINDPQADLGDRLQFDTRADGNSSPPRRIYLAPQDKATSPQDELILQQAEYNASHPIQQGEGEGEHNMMTQSRSHRSEVVDDFEKATNPVHETAAFYNPPETPNTSLAAFIKSLHQTNVAVRYFTYIIPVVLLLLIPLLVGALEFRHSANVGGVELMWFAIWLEILWLTLWAGRIVGKCLPPVVSLLATIFTNNAKKWRDMAKQLEFHAAMFFWWLGVEISFLPTMKNHHIDGDNTTRGWERTVNKIIIAIFVWTILNLIEKIIIQLIAINFHMRTYEDRIEINRFRIGSLAKLYDWSRSNTQAGIAFEEHESWSIPTGVKTPVNYARKARRVARDALNKVSDMANAVAGDFTGRKTTRSTDPIQVVRTLLHTISGCQVLARFLFHSFVRDGCDTVTLDDFKGAFGAGDEAETAFAMLDRDMNGDVSIKELEASCVDIGREIKAITASLKDLDSVVSKLDAVFMFFVFILVLIVLLSLISTSATGVLTSVGSGILGLSWMFSTTAQEFLQSVIFVFVKHPFDVGDRVTIYGKSGDTGNGDDYFVKEISLLYTEFKKMQGHIVQAPNSYLNTLFILNQRRSGALAEAVPIIIKYGTSIVQIDMLRQRLLEFVRSEKRDFQNNILTELRAVTENFSLTLNVVFFYKSSWQNEGLRLQRRNKFMCMLMLALQEIGIEGPRMNLQGAYADIPFYVKYKNSPIVRSGPKQGNAHESEEAIFREEPDAVPDHSNTTRTGATLNNQSM